MFKHSLSSKNKLGTAGASVLMLKTGAWQSDFQNIRQRKTLRNNQDYEFRTKLSLIYLRFLASPFAQASNAFSFDALTKTKFFIQIHLRLQYVHATAKHETAKGPRHCVKASIHGYFANRYRVAASSVRKFLTTASQEFHGPGLLISAKNLSLNSHSNGLKGNIGTLMCMSVSYQFTLNH